MCSAYTPLPIPLYVHKNPPQPNTKHSHTYTAPTVSMLPDMDVLVDEVTALMVSHNSNTMTLSNLTKKYNDSFRLPNNQPVEATQLQKALKKLSNFKVFKTPSTLDSCVALHVFAYC